MSERQPESMEERARREEERAAIGTAEQSDQQVATSKVEERIQNPEFLEQFTDPDADRSGEHDWTEDDFGPLFSRAHVLGNRSPDYERKAEWLGLNHAERMVVEDQPGNIVAQHPDVLAVMKGIAGPYADADMLKRQHNLPERATPPSPQTSKEKRVTRDAEEVATQRKMLSIEGEGKDALTKATSETKHVRDEKETESTTRQGLRRFFS